VVLDRIQNSMGDLKSLRRYGTVLYSLVQPCRARPRGNFSRSIQRTRLCRALPVHTGQMKRQGQGIRLSGDPEQTSPLITSLLDDETDDDVNFYLHFDDDDRS
jgi:hypothetical protein